MKRWLRRYEWMELARCENSQVHTVDNPTIEQTTIAGEICGECQVRPECIQWALSEKACSVFVAGIYIPDPELKKDVRRVYGQLESALHAELEKRSDDI